MANSYTTATIVEGEVRASAVFSSATVPTLTQVNNWIEEESTNIEVTTGVIFASTVVTSELNDYENTGEGIFRIKAAPILSFDTIRYNVNSNSVAPSWVTLESGAGYNYLEYLDEGEIEFISGNLAVNKITPNSGKQRFMLDYTKGYTTTPLEVQKLATLTVAKRVIETILNSQANTEGGSIQVGTIRVTDPGSFSTNYISGLGKSINDLYYSIGQKFKTFRGTRVY